MSVQNSKPNLSHAQVSEVVKRLFGLTTSLVKPLPSYEDQNIFVTTAEGEEYVLKVMNSADSKNLTLMEVQTYTMTFLHQHGLPAQTAVPTCSGQLMSLEEIDCGCGLQKYLVRLMTYLHGTTIAKVPSSPQILYEVGKMAAKMDKTLQKLNHPNVSVLEREKFMWSLSNIPLLEPYLKYMDGEPVQQVVKAVIEQYKTCVIPQQSSFRKCINHGDFNDHNILVQADEMTGYRISGILDFAGMSNGYYIYELAIVIMYMMTEYSAAMEVGGHVLAGWESVIPLNDAERECLYLLVLSRFSQSLVLPRHSVILQPENEEYLMIHAKTDLRYLCQLWELGKEQVERNWFQTAAQYAEEK